MKKTKAKIKRKAAPIPQISSELANVKTPRDCYETATVDAWGEEEQTVGWLTCLEEVLERTAEVLFMGEPVGLKCLDTEGERIVIAVIQKNGKTAKVLLDSIELVKPTKLQALWLRAYSEQFQHS